VLIETHRDDKCEKKKLIFVLSTSSPFVPPKESLTQYIRGTLAKEVNAGSLSPFRDVAKRASLSSMRGAQLIKNQF